MQFDKGAGQEDSPDVLLEVSGLGKTYAQITALNDVSFAVAQGEILGLLGPNGAGKSTAMMIIAGALEADSGSVTIAAEPLGRRVRAEIGLVPQEVALYPDLTGRQNLEFFASLYGLTGVALRRRASDVLATVGLDERADDRVRSYSGGMMRRLSFAVGVIHQPRVLLLDEPTVGADPRSREQLLGMIRAEARRGAAVVLASHHLEECQGICHRVLILDRGRVVVCERVHALLRRLGNRVCIAVDRTPAELASWLGDSAVSVDTDHAQILVDDHDQALCPNLLQVLTVLHEHEIRVTCIETRKPSLSGLFLDLVGS